METEMTVFEMKKHPSFQPHIDAALFSSFLSFSQESHSSLSQNKYFIFPGFCDVHVHFREPGFSYKETIRSGSLAGAAGGYTAACTMPNLRPVPDSVEHLKMQQEIIDRDALIHVYPYASITVGQKGEELSPLADMANACIAYSDDGKGIQSESMMREAMVRAKQLGKMIVAHCEDEKLLRGGYIGDGDYARIHGHRVIVNESEWGPIERDLRLSKETGCAYHVCHISCKESVDLIRKAKKEGVNVTCETGPHYLLLSEKDLQEEGRFKMNPPLRRERDRQALLEGIQDGTIDMIATDHAPHSAEEKSRGLEGSSFGIVGLETAFPLLNTYLVRKNVISMERLMELLVVNPRERFGIPFTNDYSLWEMNTERVIDAQKFLSMGKATPFDQYPVYGTCLCTVCDGKIAYQAQI